jgi:biopolymer transport protein ExbD
MTPLVDVVMVILIFLMLAGSFSVPNLLQASLGRNNPPPPFTLPDQFLAPGPLYVQVDSTPEGALRARCGGQLFTNADDLRAHLALLARQYAAAGQSIREIPVLISPAAQVPFQMIVDVQSAITEAKFSKICFAPSH